jgi:hypothetical protein
MEHCLKHILDRKFQNPAFNFELGRVIQFETTATYATSLGTVTRTCPPE